MKRIFIVSWTFFLAALLMSYEGRSEQEGNGSDNAQRSDAARGGSSLSGYRDLLLLSQELAQKSVENRKLALLLADSLGWPIAGKTAEALRFELQCLEFGFPCYYVELNNTDAAITTRTDSVQYYIGGGSGLTIGLWDGGAPRMTHQELAGRVTWGDSKTPVADDHATHVSGTLAGAGVRPQARGMAPEASIRAFEWTNDLAEMAYEAGQGVLVSNHSYGFIRGWENLRNWYWFGDTAISEVEDYLFGFYSASARELDEILWAAPNYLPVFAAGNDRNDSVPPGTPHYYFDSRYNSWRQSTKVRNNDGAPLGYDCLPNGASLAKNALLVGAVKPVLNYAGPESVEMTPYSSFGPTDDGRIKPDVCGDGWAVYSSIAESDTSYAYYYGTSMSSPNVCGSLGLLQDYYRETHHGLPMRSATLRALVAHTAREAGPYPGPDYGFGWGLLDAYGAFRLIRDDLDDRLGLIEELLLLEGRVVEFRYYCDGTESELRVTIAWTDPPGSPPRPALDPPDPMLVNDLDLRLEKDTVTFEPWILDPLDPSAPAERGDNSVDNIEQVVIENPEAGIYTIRVYNDGPLQGGSQDFSLVVSGARRIATWNVFVDGSGDAPTIAAAVDSASSGDLILVYPGIYNEHDIVLDKSVSIKGIRGAYMTRVNARGLGRCFLLPEGTGPVTIEGLTLKGGLVQGIEEDGCGGAIFSENEELSLIGCEVVGNSAARGGGIFSRNGLKSMIHCVLRGNKATEFGGGICLEDSNAELDRCVLAWNECSGDGGAMHLAGSHANLENCTVAYNIASGRGGSIYFDLNSGATVAGSILAFTLQGQALYKDVSGDMVTLSCCDVFGNFMGDTGGALELDAIADRVISSDPEFCNANQFDFGIGDGSPCLSEKNDCGQLIGAIGARCHTKTTWLVRADGSGDAPDIASAVERASQGDTILLDSGVFTGLGNRDISFGGKNLVVRSIAGAAGTILDCGGSIGEVHFGFSFEGGENAESVIEGLTIRNASNGGIRCVGSSPVIRSCIVDSCVTNGATRGGGIYLEESNASVIGCTLTRNIANPTGGAIYMRDSKALVTDCLVMGNSATRYGGGIGVHTGSDSRITGCTITGNTAIGDHGGGLYVVSARATIDSCTIADNSGTFGGGVYFGLNSNGSLKNSVITGNVATSGGGGMYANSNTTVENCTIAENLCPGYGSGVESVSAALNSISRSIIAFNSGSAGLYSVNGLQVISCSDVYGNAAGDYGGSTSNQTGINGNFSLDPGFCDAASGNFAIYDTSSCSADKSPCSKLVGALDVGCRIAPNLVIESVEPDSVETFAGSSILFKVVVRNSGVLDADTFAIDYFANRASAPLEEAGGDIEIIVAGLATGDTVVRYLGPIVTDTVGTWFSWILVDAADQVTETNESDNLSGPHSIVWNVPRESGWPVSIGPGITSPLLCDLDGDGSTLEVVVGCNDGSVHALGCDGIELPGWPVSLGGSVSHAPAAGRIGTGSGLGVVVGCEDSSLCALDREGTKLWELSLPAALLGSPVLEDLDGDGKAEILFGAAGYLYALRGDGSSFPGAWPFDSGLDSVSSPAVGDMDGDGFPEIAAIGWRGGSPSSSLVYLLNKDGTCYSPDWPVTVGEILDSSPTIGDISGHHGSLEIAVAARSKVYAWNLDGSSCFVPPTILGKVESPLALADLDGDGYLDITVTSRRAGEEGGAPVWDDYASAVSAARGTILSRKISRSFEDIGALAGPITLGKPADVMVGTQEGSVCEALGGYNFRVGAAISATPSAGDIDGDGWVELVVATADDSLRCFELRMPRATPNNLLWPQERRSASRSACFGYEPVAGDKEEPADMVPSLTALRSLFPNPFNPAVSVVFDLATHDHVKLAIYDVTGREIAVLLSRELEAGRYELHWDGLDSEGKKASSGVYFCVLTAGGRLEAKKIVLLR